LCMSYGSRLGRGRSCGYPWSVHCLCVSILTTTNNVSVWQIAVRDYKFGKGKHSSLTKATYDAVGNKFRSLWGQEAGWAHSVLFTADLKAFSERLVAKTEVKEEVKEIKTEDGLPIEETAIKEEKTLIKGIKREAEEDEEKLIETKHNIVKKAKRRKKASY
jgi:N-glycosylase/DNA lyase